MGLDDRLLLIWLMVALAICAAGCSRDADPVPSDIRQALPNVRVTAYARGDLDRDGTREAVAITSTSDDSEHPMGGEIIVLQPRQGRLRPVWRQANLNPWKLQIADVDGDGPREIVAGVWKKSPKDPVMARRTFVYSWNGRRMLPKWLGSRLARRFNDFALADINGDGWDELAALEIMPHGRHRVSLYRWKSFGFEWLGCSGEIAGATRLQVAGNRVTVATGKGTRSVVMKNGSVKLINRRHVHVQ